MLSRDGTGSDEAEKTYAKASEILERLARENRLTPLYREELARTLVGRAAVRVASGNLLGAEADIKEAFALLDRLIAQETAKKAVRSPQYASIRARVLEQQSRLHSARKESVKAKMRWPWRSARSNEPSLSIRRGRSTTSFAAA